MVHSSVAVRFHALVHCQSSVFLSLHGSNFHSVTIRVRDSRRMVGVLCSGGSHTVFGTLQGRWFTPACRYAWTHLVHANRSVCLRQNGSHAGFDVLGL